MWAFCGDPRPLPSCFVVVLFVVVALFHSFIIVGSFCWKEGQDKIKTRRQDQDQEEEGKHLNHIWKQERG